MTSRRARLVQFLGILVVMLGMAGYWLERDVQRTILDAPTRTVLGVADGAFQASFVVAGRDYDYPSAAGGFVWRDGRRVRAYAAEPVYGNRTDTILYVNVVGTKVYMIAIPRDVYLPQYQTKINAMYYYQQAEGVKQAVSEVLGLPVDYYAVVSIDVFREMVDAIGGVEVNVPYRMYHEDQAAGLLIDLQPGSQWLDGKEASDFVRFRDTELGDYDRVDNVKTLARAMLARIKALNVRAVGAVPDLWETYQDQVETNATPALVAQLLPRLGNLEIYSATLPTYYIDGTSNLGVSARRTEAMIADLFGGEARDIAEVPEATLLITNRSGVSGLELWLQQRLVSLGVPEQRLIVRTASADPAPTRLLVDANSWQQANYYAELLHVGQQQMARNEALSRTDADIELILGQDAARFVAAQPLVMTATAEGE